MNKSFLKNFIDEDVYVLNEDSAQKGEPDTLKKSKVQMVEQENVEIVSEPKEEYNPVELQYKGGNQKSIAILVNYESEEHINPEDESFLLKILSAVGLTINDVAIINTYKHPKLSISVLKESSFDICLSFAIPSLTPDFEYYKISKSEQISVLNCHPLKGISEDVSLKKALWNSLKTLFSAG